MESGGRLAGRLPYLHRRRALGLATIGMPALTHYLGPAIAPEFESASAVRSLKSLGIISGLLSGLPPAIHVSFRLHSGIRDTLAFDRAGFLSTTQFTVEILPAPVERLWTQLRDKTRNMIRRAEENLAVAPCMEAAFFSRFYNECLNSAGKQNAYDEEKVATLAAEVLRRGKGRILVAATPDSSPQAAVFTVWDNEREYYFMSCRLPGAHRGSIQLLIWAALQQAATSGRVFDMDGIHVVGDKLPNLILSTGFGGTIVPRFWVSRTSPLVKLMSTLLTASRR